MLSRAIIVVVAVLLGQSHASDSPYVDREIFVAVPSQPKTPISDVESIVGIYEYIGVERHKETSGVTYQFLEIKKPVGKFIYSENIAKPFQFICEVPFESFTREQAQFVFRQLSCNIHGEYTLYLTPQFSHDTSRFPLKSDAWLSFTRTDQGSHFVITSQRLRYMNGKSIKTLLEEVNNR